MILPKFNDELLCIQAFTHRSYLNEAKQKTDSNERLEFLGDSILSFIVSEFLYKAYPEYSEGTLTNLRSLLVNTKSLAIWAQKLDFGKHLRLSRGEEESKGRENQSLLADCFESFIGALYLDQGIVAVQKFLTETILTEVPGLVEKKAFKDPKSLLQEHVQAAKQNSPVYKVLEEEGPPHAKTFTIGVFVMEKQIGEGKGRSKQIAEENAAQAALEKISK